MDAKAQKLWKAYSEARDKMLERTHTVTSPWTVVRTGDKEHARLNCYSRYAVAAELSGKAPSPAQARSGGRFSLR